MKSDEAKRKKLYVERDISWMYFNQRILLEAALWRLFLRSLRRSRSYTEPHCRVR